MFTMKTVGDFRTLEEALAEAEHWRLDKDQTFIENTDSGVQRSVTEWLADCTHSVTHPVLTETGEQTGKQRCPVCGQTI
jgi:hypothetical protein